MTDRLWEAVLYLYHVGPRNQPRWEPNISFIQLKKKPYILVLIFFVLFCFLRQKTSYVPLGWSASCLCFSNGGQPFRCVSHSATTGIHSFHNLTFVPPSTTTPAPSFWFAFNHLTLSLILKKENISFKTVILDF